MEILALIGAIMATASAQIFYKLVFRYNKSRLLLLSILFFFAASVFTYLALGALNIGLVYMSMAVTQLLIVALSYFVLGERLTMSHGFGMVLIISGLFIYAHSPF